jgi:hypothetical protein
MKLLSKNQISLDWAVANRLAALPDSGTPAERQNSALVKLTLLRLLAQCGCHIF